MLEHLINQYLPEIIHVLEIIGIFIITLGSIKTFIYYVLSLFNKKKYPVRLELGYSLALGLEFKMGAEILKTVLVRDLTEIWILGAIIILRAVLSLLIHFEMKEEAHTHIEPAHPHHPHTIVIKNAHPFMSRERHLNHLRTRSRMGSPAGFGRDGHVDGRVESEHHEDIVIDNDILMKEKEELERK